MISKDITESTRTAIRQIPKAWQKLGLNFQQLTRKDIITVNLLATLTGVIAGYAAIGFRYMIGFLQNAVMYGELDPHLTSPTLHEHGYWIIGIPALGLLCSTLLTRFFAPEAKGHGVPEVIQAVWTRGGRMRKRIVGLKALASSITIATGGSVGREGPIVQIGSAAGSAIGQLLDLKPTLLKTLVGCGAGGAIAATFNTPVAGVIFAIEIIVLELKTKSFIPLVISSVMATVVARHHLGNEPAFFVPRYALGEPTELLFYIGLGILSGIVGVIFIRTLYGMEDLFDNMKVPFYFKPFIGGLPLGLLIYFCPQIMGVGYEAMTDVLQQQSSFPLMSSLVVLKVIAVSLTLAAGGSGGVFAPSLFIGAMLGGAYGSIVSQVYPDIASGYGPYALVGMAALFSATGRASFTAIVILFEMTLDYSLILPLMLVCVIADQTSWALSKDSIYSLKLRRKGLAFITDFGVNTMAFTRVRDIMTTQVESFTDDMSIEKARDHALQTGHAVYPVVNESRIFTGIVRTERIAQSTKGRVADYKEQPKVFVHPDENVIEAVRRIEKTKDPRIVVVEPGTHKLLGVVSPIDFIRLHSTEEEDSRYNI